MSKSLHLPNITMEDKGLYRCTAEIDPTKNTTVSAKVIVFGEYDPEDHKLKKYN